MTNLIIAFVLALVGVVTTSFGLSFVGLPEAYAASMSSVIMAGVPYVHKNLEIRKRAKTSNSAGDNVLTFDGFQQPNLLLVVYGVTMFFAILQFTSAIGGILAITFSEGLGAIVPSVAVLTVFFGLPCAYFIGRWVGQRSKGRGWLTVIAIALGTRILGSIVDFAILSSQDFKEVFGTEKSIEYFFIQLIAGGILFSIPLLIGYWRGHKQKLITYVSYLLKSLPTDAQLALAELAYEETRQLKFREKPISEVQKQEDGSYSVQQI